MKTKMFLLGLMPCVYACQNTGNPMKGKSCEEKMKARKCGVCMTRAAISFDKEVWEAPSTRRYSNVYKKPHLRNQPWSQDEKARLKSLVGQYRADWEKISAEIGRSETACHSRAQVLGLLPPKDKIWGPEAEEILRDLVRRHGTDWKKISAEMGRPASTCQAKARQLNLFTCKYSRWAPEDEAILRDLIKQHGTNWKKISAEIGRSILACYHKARNLGLLSNRGTQWERFEDGVDENLELPVLKIDDGYATTENDGRQNFDDLNSVDFFDLDEQTAFHVWGNP